MKNLFYNQYADFFDDKEQRAKRGFHLIPLSKTGCPKSATYRQARYRDFNR